MARTMAVALSLAAAGLMLTWANARAGGGAEALPVGLFSQEDPGHKTPGGWAPLHFRKIKNHTQYELVRDEGVTVVRAESRAGASGLVRKITVDPSRFPIIAWRWKALNLLEKGDVTQKRGDDYPARIYVTFQYDPDRVGPWDRAKYAAAKTLHGEYPPHAVINYIWASKAPKGTMTPNPYSDRVMMFAVESGDENLGAWVEEERNILEDYKSAFGEPPPLVSGVAVMTDADNTGESVAAFYGDIVFKAGPSGPGAPAPATP